MQELPGPKAGPGPQPMYMLTFLTLWPIYLQTYFLSPTKNEFIFSKKYYNLLSWKNTIFVTCLHKLLVEKFKEKVPGKVGECIFDS